MLKILDKQLWCNNQWENIGAMDFFRQYGYSLLIPEKIDVAC